MIISQRSPVSLEPLNPLANPNSPPKSHTVARKIPKLPLRAHRPRTPEISPLWRRACAAALRKKRARRKPPNTTRPPHPEARAPKRPALTGGLGFRSGPTHIKRSGRRGQQPPSSRFTQTAPRPIIPSAARPRAASHLRGAEASAPPAAAAGQSRSPTATRIRFRCMLIRSNPSPSGVPRSPRGLDWWGRV